MKRGAAAAEAAAHGEERGALLTHQGGERGARTGAPLPAGVVAVAAAEAAARGTETETVLALGMGPILRAPVGAGGCLTVAPGAPMILRPQTLWGEAPKGIKETEVLALQMGEGPKGALKRTRGKNGGNEGRSCSAGLEGAPMGLLLLRLRQQRPRQHQQQSSHKGPPTLTGGINKRPWGTPGGPMGPPLLISCSSLRI